MVFPTVDRLVIGPWGEDGAAGEEENKEEDGLICKIHSSRRTQMKTHAPFPSSIRFDNLLFCNQNGIKDQRHTLLVF